MRLASLALLVLVLAACSGDREPTAKTDPGNSSTTQAAMLVEITADGFKPASAEVSMGHGLNFKNTDSKPHTIIGPAGNEHVVGAGETFSPEGGHCCAATFTDKKTGAEFLITVADPF
jgi:plastocyanin